MVNTSSRTKDSKTLDPIEFIFSEMVYPYILKTGGKHHGQKKIHPQSLSQNV